MKDTNKHQNTLDETEIPLKETKKKAKYHR